MKVFFSKYFLAGRTSQPSQEGALLRLEDQNSFGVADICPKPQFGDLSLHEELEHRGPLFRRAFELAQEDLLARKSGRSLLQDKTIVNNLLLLNYEKIETVENCTYKIKADRNFKELIDLLQTLPRARLDFNSKLTTEEFEYFLRLLPEGLKPRIEYIEDPTLLSAHWERWNKIIPLAYDLQKKSEYSHKLAKYRVVKPSRERLPADMLNVILTSAMDHPVGVAHGFRIAQKLANNVPGFLTLDLYEETGFNRFFSQNGNLLNFSKIALAETGIGMTAELNAADWISLG